MSHHGDAFIEKIHIATAPKAVGPVDMILFCVKLWDLDKAAEQIKPMLKADTAVYSFQNGIYAEGVWSNCSGLNTSSAAMPRRLSPSPNRA
ncbi:MAG: 2-dehydropantoate 2-reductase N-terminal domain-containing protein [Bradyrhizobium sp.]